MRTLTVTRICGTNCKPAILSDHDEDDDDDDDDYGDSVQHK